ncbi:MAG: chlorophyll synthase ChlG [Candidatus Atelocyanobacterium thalassa]|uniref:Chlorophyll synthase n=1 Tax=Candidatus Atelocyanobacterium thalassa isolate SIO64986 TaxID=1527444 RepID=A0A086CI68_9CHRO|nr:MAG: chlorophyll synthase [Candidatus Atelocyanobacterium thalassa isolate SIO64986]
MSVSTNLDKNKTNNQARQLLGMKGGIYEKKSIWKLRLQLTKPITWVPLIWGVICGAASSGNYFWTIEDFAKVLACMVLSGPLMTGYTQTLNDFYDREIDAINEPYRPIPSGAISVSQVIVQILVLLTLGIVLSYGLDVWSNHEFPTMLCLTLGGAFISYIYSAPPLKLKRNGWLGNYALGASYIALPWWAGHALFGELNYTIVILTLFYSFSGLGIAIINDFKSIEGDSKLGLSSMPVMFGVTIASWICVMMIDIFQIGIGSYLIYIHENLYATILLLLVIPQITLQDMYFLRDPLKNDVKYQAMAQPFLVLGMLVVGLALGRQVV